VNTGPRRMADGAGSAVEGGSKHPVPSRFSQSVEEPQMVWPPPTLLVPTSIHDTLSERNGNPSDQGVIDGCGGDVWIPRSCGGRPTAALWG
jgi:hypothetical protein